MKYLDIFEFLYFVIILLFGFYMTAKKLTLPLLASVKKCRTHVILTVILIVIAMLKPKSFLVKTQSKGVRQQILSF